MGLAVVFVVVVSGCGGVAKVVVRTVTAPPRPTAKLSSSSHPSFPSLVANVRSGVIRIEGTSCAGQDVGTGSSSLRPWSRLSSMWSTVRH
jgi:hypothetical protein